MQELIANGTSTALVSPSTWWRGRGAGNRGLGEAPATGQRARIQPSTVSQSNLLWLCACKVVASQRSQMTTEGPELRFQFHSVTPSAARGAPLSFPFFQQPISPVTLQQSFPVLIPITSRVRKVRPIEDVRGDAGRAADALVRLAAGSRASQGLRAVPQHDHVGAAPWGR